MFQRTKICSGLLVAISAGSFGMAGSAQAQDTTPVQRVEVLGSSIKRVDAESDAPITTLTREDIARTGASTVEELLRSITAAQSSGSTAAASGSGSTTAGISTISLRGLGPNRTLVLINGQRTAPYGDPANGAVVDLDSIPVAAIERIDILKEGAGAIYGSDAVAGVVNFVLRKNYSGVEINGSAGTSYDSKGSVFRGSFVAGTDIGGGKGNALMILSAEHNSPLYGKDRGFASKTVSPEHRNNGGSSNSAPANINIPGVGLLNPNIPVDPVTLKPSGPITGNPCGPDSTYSPTIAPSKCLFDPAPFVSLEPDIKKVGAVFSGHYDFSEALSLHADLSLTNKKTYTLIQPAPLSSPVGIPFTMTTDNPFYPTAFVKGVAGGATPDLSVFYRPFLTGQRGLTDDATQTRASFGIDGSVAGWDYSANALYATGKVIENLDSGYFRINGGAGSGGPGIEALLNGQDKDAAGNTLWVNPFGDNSAAVLAAANATNYTGKAFATGTILQDAQFKINKGDFLKWRGGDVGLAFGVEMRRDTFKLDATPALASGDISGYGGNFSPISRERSVQSAFAELDVPFFKGFDVDAAVRYDHYGATENPGAAAGFTSILQGITYQDASGNNDGLPSSVISSVVTQSLQSAPSFGHTTGKLGARWEVNKQLLVRSTYSTGFLAPSLLQLYGPLQANITTVIDDPKRCTVEGAGGAECAYQPNTYIGGNGALKPERSATLTLGTVFEPVKDMSFAVDYFHTKLKDAITVLSPTFMLSHEALYTSAITRGPSDGVGPAGTPGPIIAIDQRNQNVTQNIVAGFDFDAHGTWRSASGTYGLGVAGTWQTKWDQVNPDGSHESEIAKTSASDVGFTPRLKLTSVLTYRTPDSHWEGTFIYNWQSGATDLCGSLDRDQYGNCKPGISAPHVKSYGTTDLQVKWDPSKSFSGTLGVKDALNAKVPYANGAGGAFQGGYDPTYVDPHGRFWYTSATVRF